MEGGAADGPLPEDGPDSGDSAAQFIESVLSLHGTPLRHDRRADSAPSAT